MKNVWKTVISTPIPSRLIIYSLSVLNAKSARWNLLSTLDIATFKLSISNFKLKFSSTRSGTGNLVKPSHKSTWKLISQKLQYAVFTNVLTNMVVSKLFKGTLIRLAAAADIYYLWLPVSTRHLTCIVKLPQDI